MSATKWMEFEATNAAGSTNDLAQHYKYDQSISTPVYLPDVRKKKNFYFFMKRAMDIVLSFFGLVILFPLFLIVALAIKLDSKGAVIYTQTRIGKKGKPFTLYKFRSMCVGAEEKLKDLQALNERDGPAFKISNDPRVTKVGGFIRKTCIDELPQLVNIIKGDMSIVGPRPPLPNEVEQYTPYQMRRLGIRPGLTCYWQVSGRRDVTFNEWVRMDLRYIRECGIFVDIKLIFKAFGVIFRNGGAQ